MAQEPIPGIVQKAAAPLPGTFRAIALDWRSRADPRNTSTRTKNTRVLCMACIAFAWQNSRAIGDLPLTSASASG